MAKLEASITINRPVEEVFAFTSNPEMSPCGGQSYWNWSKHRKAQLEWARLTEK